MQLSETKTSNEQSIIQLKGFNWEPFGKIKGRSG